MLQQRQKVSPRRCGRDEDFSSPPAQIPAGAANAPGPTLDSDEEPLFWPRMQDAWERQVAVGDLFHSNSIGRVRYVSASHDGISVN